MSIFESSGCLKKIHIFLPRVATKSHILSTSMAKCDLYRSTARITWPDLFRFLQCVQTVVYILRSVKWFKGVMVGRHFSL